MEVGILGIRIMRPDGRDAVAAIPWTQVHSWTHAQNRFTFKFCSER